MVYCYNTDLCKYVQNYSLVSCGDDGVVDDVDDYDDDDDGVDDDGVDDDDDDGDDEDCLTILDRRSNVCL